MQPYDHRYSAVDALGEYVHLAVLPEMVNGPSAPPLPLAGHKSHLNKLKVRLERFRRFESITRLGDDKMDECIVEWNKAHIPTNPITGVEDRDPISGERISIPCPEFFKVPLYESRLPEDVSRVASWVDDLPLQTAQRIFHIVFPETMGWRFIPCNDFHGDNDIFRHFLWTHPVQQGNPYLNTSHQSVVVAVQPSWILSPADFDGFVHCRSFPDWRDFDPLTSRPLNSKERLWAKMWDLCAAKKCHWFVVSTYTNWVFGVFTKGWTRSYISSVYSFDLKTPRILEYLLFWLASAMGLPGGFIIPEVCSEPENFISEPSVAYDLTAHNPELAYALSLL